jgi:lon-related putative ATP-dependent protease
MTKELSADKIRKECDTSFMHCKTTKDLKPLLKIIGQKRAVRALKFGLGIKDHGFNIYVAGYPGTGRKTAVKNFVEEIALAEPTPPDWCYVNNFSNQYEPAAIKLPFGKGKEFKDEIKNLIESIRVALPKAFESEDYTSRRETTLRDLEKQRKELIDSINTKAKQEGFLIQNTQVGLLLVPIINGKPISQEELLKLPQETKNKIQEKRERLETKLRSTMRQFLTMEQKIREALKKLNRDVALYAIGHLVDALKEKYKDNPKVIEYLTGIQNDILDNLGLFAARRQQQQNQPQLQAPWMKEAPFKKFKVNVIVDNSNIKGAPVVIEFNPNYQNLFGRTEKEAQFGALVTDFTMIHSGALHKANGGYLIIPVEDLLRNPFAYDGLKRALKNELISIEEPQEKYGFINIKSLKPQPIPLNAKVILIGDPNLYRQLFALDKDFSELFKVKAEFDTTMERTEANLKQYAGFVCTLCQKEKLKHLDGSGLAKLIEYSQRLAQDQEKLSTRFSEVADIIREANFYAKQENANAVSSDFVRRAIEEKIYRSKMIQEKIQEMIKRGVILIDTEKEKVGQINGLAVMGIGDFSFGSSSRVTASIGLGRDGIVDIEREAKMGGPIHTKGVLILSGYLNEKFAKENPLSLSARLVFEQNYGGVDGDSASSTELYAILSAISSVPVKQNIAVTGSVNQKGEVQAIGGVNEKIEGFFEICKIKGLNSMQGVMIPESNAQNLMLKEEIVEAVKAGKFHIYTAKTIDEGIEVLTGIKAGERQNDGIFQKDSINYLVDKRLRQMAEKLKEFPTSEKTSKKRQNNNMAKT